MNANLVAYQRSAIQVVSTNQNDANLTHLKKLRCKVDWISLYRRIQIIYYFDLLPGLLPSLVQTIRYERRSHQAAQSANNYIVIPKLK